MEEQGSYIVQGYRFYSKKEADLAEKEFEKVRAIYEKLDIQNLKAVKAVYLKALEQHAFETEVGFSFLRDIRLHLVKKGVIAMEEYPFPVQNSKYALQTEMEHMREEFQLSYESKIERLQQSIEEQKENVEKEKRKTKTFRFVTVLLLLALVGMFVISLTGKNPNILNYRRAITNEYSDWEEDLKQREETIRQKEAMNFTE